jgi:hypothetical protein
MMMRKKLLAAAVAAGILAPITSQAVNVSLDGSGQALLYPYYNVNDGNMTFVSVTNTTHVAKAVKVRFREGAGSEDVFDFTLYLSPEDVWVAAISRSGDNVVMSIPEDTSCTVPGKAALQAGTFNSTRIPAAYTQSVANRLSEGHIEIIEMAELPNTATANDITAAITHNQSTTPPTPVDCGVPTTFSSAETSAILDAGVVTEGGVTQDFAAPGGGLVGNAAVFNPTSGIYYPYNATALNQYSANPIWWPQNAQAFQTIAVVGTVASPGSTSSTSDSNGNARSNYFTADDDAPLTGGNAMNFDLPDLSTPSVDEVDAGAAVARQYTTNTASTPVIKSGTFTATAPEIEDAKRNAVTAALMGNAITGEYLTTNTYGTDWIVTFPTRYLHVTEDTAAEITAGTGDAHATDPFDTVQTTDSAQACHEMKFDYWNREESQNLVNINVGISPGVPTAGVSLCYEVNVLSMNDSSAAGAASDVVGSITNKTTFPLGANFNDGWARLGFGDYSLISDDATAVTFTGLPVIGFSAVNDTIAGTEKGGVFPSRVTFDQVAVPQ